VDRVEGHARVRALSRDREADRRDRAHAARRAAPPQLERDPAAERVADRVRALEAQLLDGGRERLDGRRAAERRRLAEAGQVDRDHLVLAREQRHDGIPDAAVEADAVHQHDRRAASGAGVLEHRAAAYGPPVAPGLRYVCANRRISFAGPAMLTLRDLLSDVAVRAVSGGDEFDVPVRWVHISELEDPTPFLSGGELLLTTGMALTDEATQRAYVARLAEHGLAGLGLGTGFAHDTLPPALVQAAAEHDFPLFEVPYELPFIALTEKAFTHLVNEQYAVLRRALAAHERLERIVLSEQGLDGVATALSALIGGPALIFDGRGEELASSGAEPGVAAEAGA